VSTALLVAAELRLRTDERDVTYLWDSGRRFATRPGAHGTNARSYHERDIAWGPAAPGVRRVVVVGDSTTWGTGPADEAWPRLAEQRLGAGWQVLNLSHYGYDIAQIDAVLREDAWSLRPDLVIYAAYTNDPVPTRAIEVGGGLVWVGEDALFSLPARRASALARRVEGALLRGRVDATPDWDRYGRELASMQGDADAHGVPLIVLGLIPWALTADDPACGPACRAQADIERRQVRVSEALGLPHIRTADALRDAARAGRDLAPPDRADWQHAGREGHAVIAEVAVGMVRGVFEAGPQAPRMPP
jgi:hypothetical protein